jgi:Ca2+-binding RTX toxin-like protein
VDTFLFNAPDDVLAFVGVWSDRPFDKVEIRDTTATIDDEYFGEVFTGATPLQFCTKAPDFDGDGIPDVVDECPKLPTTSLIVGTAGNDILMGTQGNDLIRGLAGNDIIHGRGGNDCIVGGAGHDRLNGQVGKDILLGEKGKDMLNGGPGVDNCDGGADIDTAAACEAVSNVP